ncbi:hypothetical protein HKX48_008689 [Thoreauomyces humboldtii]|nr:hypothetical protein HKX48_008689 [Thoreauomyces humboldtii]
MCGGHSHDHAAPVDLLADSSSPAATSNLLLESLSPYLPNFLLTLLMDKHILAFSMALVASMGTFLGGVVVVVLAKLTGADPNSPATARLMGVLQAFSAGVMMYITCFDLVPEAVAELGSRECMMWFFSGVVVFGVLEECILPEDHGHDHDDDDKEKKVVAEEATKGRVLKEVAKDAAGKDVTTGKFAGPTDKERRDLMRSSLITFVALAMHNLPEGLGVYLSALSDLRLGSQLAMAILLHNIPEGMAVAIPLYAATGKTTQVLWWTLLNGLAEPAGVVVGGLVLAPYLSPALLSRCLAAVGGIMVCISMHELQPTAIKYAGKATATASFFGGMFVCFGALEAVNEWFGGHVH